MPAILAATLLAGPALPKDATPWPKFYGQVGAYDVRTPDEIADMAHQGFHLALLSYGAAHKNLAGAIEANSIRYIDNFPSGEINRLCRKQYRAWGGCPQADVDTALQNIKNHLRDTADDKAIIGYWILDDYPRADVRPVLAQVHRLIADANRTAIFARPAICGFGGKMDVRMVKRGGALSSDTRPFVRAVTNFDPASCDLVAVYPYATSDTSDSSSADWQMTSLLPAMLDALRAQGWDPARQPMIGMPQTFGGARSESPGLYYVVPRAGDVAAQAEAYCRAGAVALLAYTWHDNHGDELSELHNSPDLVSGLKQGAARCRDAYWNR